MVPQPLLEAVKPGRGRPIAPMPNVRRAQQLATERGPRGDLHDLCNLLQVVTSAIGLMERRQGSGRGPTVQEILPGASEAISQASLLARRLLDRPDDDDREETVEIVPTLERAAAWARALAPTGVRVVLRSPTLNGVVACGSSAIDNALLNLVKNALQAVGNVGSVKIGAILAPGDAAGQVGIFVEDDGAGIDDRVKDDLFTIGISGRAGGKGLGLAGVAEFVGGVGGNVLIASDGARGTRVTLSLPLGQADG